MLAMVQNIDAPPKDAATFDDFWTLYPKRMARKDARKAWERVSASDRIDALVSLCKWRLLWMARGEMQYVPMPATWLNGERWSDEPPADAVPTHASQTAFPARPAVEARGEIPAHVREAIARLRK